MPANVDADFFKRTDQHLDLCNAQCATTTPGKVVASTMFAAARFNTWVAAHHAKSSEDYASRRAETIAHFVEQYRLMLEENYADHLRHFDGDKTNPVK